MLQVILFSLPVRLYSSRLTLPRFIARLPHVHQAVDQEMARLALGANRTFPGRRLNVSLCETVGQNEVAR